MNDNLGGRPAARASAQACQAGGGARGAGAQPSITAPANSIRPLRHGVDSLYLSFSGGIDTELALWLQECKERAQSNNENVVSLAGIGVSVTAPELGSTRPRNPRV